MTHTLLVRAAVVAALALTVSAVQVRGQAITQPQGVTPRAHVTLALLDTSRDGTTGSAAAAEADLAVGEEWVGGVSADFRGSRGAGGWPSDNTGYAWRVKVRVLAIQIETIQVEVTWGRYGPGSAHAGPPDIGDTRIVSLMTGDRHALDFVQSDVPDSRIVNHVVEIRAGMVDDPAVRYTSIEYDVWFVHESPTGAQTTRRVVLSGSSGTWQSFSFRPLGFGLDGGFLPVDSPAPVVAVSDGQVLGRPRRDGTIALVVRSFFGIDCSTNGEPAGEVGRTGGEGQKQVIAGNGEAIRIELPTTVGWCTVAPRPPAPSNMRPGVKEVAGGLRVVGADFFREDRFSLVITARRVR